MKNKTWKDTFWKSRYFQPDKNITRWEAAYIFDLIFWQ
jgi:hypothetical protein